ncbi:MAG: AAA family ATPase, partial [Butyricicoccaceae bacterium]
MEYKTDLIDALSYIRAADLDYQDWLAVGMALKEAQYPVEVWDEWSQSDSRYHSGECEKKWAGFHGAPDPVTAGTIVHLARQNGWKPQIAQEGHELGWEDDIGGGREKRSAPAQNGIQQLVTYLETLFEASETVGYVVQSWQRDEDGKYLPKRGNYDRTAGQLIEELNHCGGDIGSVLGDINHPEAGAWIRFNPLDGKGVKNENVTEYRYALVESDSMPIEEQRDVIDQLRLPVAALVYSGGKSVHAIVRVEAGSYDEYRKRVDYLYRICKDKGLDIDRQNRNPSRLSRMPGAMRGDQEQTLLGVNLGFASWKEWYDYTETINDDLPDAESMESVWNNLPALAPPLIEGILRQGHKMLLAGPSKAAKSFSLIELSICIAEGKRWMGFACAQGRVLYVNLELDRASCLHRFRDVYTAMGIEPEHLNNLDIWNLRGKSVPMDALAPKLIRRAAGRGYLAIIIDPIYKVITGDENSADQMAKFCNQFDKVCTELGCAVIYCHHHSKGAQGGKRSMDRASGSGVFARDPDALLDLIELEISEDLRTQLTNNAVGQECGRWLEQYGHADEVGQDDLCSEKAALAACKELLRPSTYDRLQSALEGVRAAVSARTAWRIEATLREFPKLPPVNIWFDYPVHRIDDSGVLADIQPDAEQPSWKQNFKKSGKRNKSPEERKKDRTKAIDTAFEACSSFGEKVTIASLSE